MRSIAGWGAIALLLGAACAGRAGGLLARHEAVQKAYPKDRYVVGVGEGPTLELARRRAAVEISSQLQGSLRAEGWVEAEAASVDGVQRSRESVREEIRVATGLARLEWIEVVSARTRGDTVEVFAVLDRHRVAEGLRSEIDDRLAGLDSALDRWEGARGLLARAKALAELERDRQAIQSSLDLLAAVSRRPSRRPEAFLRLDRAQREVRAQLGRIAWEICLEPGQNQPLVAIFAGRLAQKGLSTMECGAEAGDRGPVWILRGRLGATLQEMNHPGGYPYFCATQLGFEVEEKDGASVAGGVAHGLRSGAMAREDACAQSARALADDFLLQIGWESADLSRADGPRTSLPSPRRTP
ncbi:MAG: hypothetical protein DIU72_009025 [Pseudomonadota bacterium]|nr:MAG: hypothetical protein DIU72_10295 [Pseudomonadota bacterium]